MSKKSVLFVCLGNICRSPVAEGIFSKLVAERKICDEFEIESRGTGSWHIGQGAHKTSTDVAMQYGVDITKHKASQFSAQDFSDFDYILAMDSSNKRDMLALDKVGHPFVRLIREFDSEALATEQDVPDPFYAEGEQGFHEVHKILERSCEALLEEVLGKS